MAIDNSFRKPKPAFHLVRDVPKGGQQFDAVVEKTIQWLNSDIVALSEAEIAQRQSAVVNQSARFSVIAHDDGSKSFILSYERLRQTSMIQAADDGPAHAAVKSATKVIYHADTNGNLSISIKRGMAHLQRLKADQLNPSQLYVHPSTLLGIVDEALGIKADGKRLGTKPTVVTPKNFDSVVALVRGTLGKSTTETKRDLPVIVITEPNYHADRKGVPDTRKKTWPDMCAKLAVQLAGLAHIVTLSGDMRAQFNAKFPEYSWQDDQALKSGEICLYPSLPDPEAVEGEDNRLFLREAISSGQTNVPEIVDGLLRQTLNTNKGADAHIPKFETLEKLASEKRHAGSLDNISAARVQELEARIERLTMARDQEAQGFTEAAADNHALGEEVKRLRDELKVMTRALDMTQRELASEKKRADAAEAKVKRLEGWDKHENVDWKIASYVLTVPVPNQIDKVSDWAGKYFPDSLEVCAAFQKECDKESDGYDRTENFYKFLTILGMYYSTDTKWDAIKKSDRDKWFTDEGKTRPFVEVAKKYGLTAGKSGDLNVATERGYEALDTRGEKWDLNLHGGDNSTGRKSGEILRIYYADSKRPISRIKLGKGPKHLPVGTHKN